MGAGRRAVSTGLGGGRRPRALREHSPVLQAWTPTPGSRNQSRRGSVFQAVGAGVEDSGRMARQAWAAFEDQIKEITDDTQYFTQRRQRRFRASDAFKQVLTDISYAPPVEVRPCEENVASDVPSLSCRPGSAADHPDGSPGPPADGEWTDRQSVFSFPEDDVLSVSRGASLGRKSPSVLLLRERDYASIVTGRLTPAEEEPPEVEQTGSAPPIVPVADLYTDFKGMRGELYHRYLEHPETWTEGLSKHLQKSFIRERVPTSKTGWLTQTFRPKSAIVSGARSDLLGANSRHKRVQSAHTNLPTITDGDEPKGSIFLKGARRPSKSPTFRR